MEYKISNHAEERYASRIMEKETNGDIKVYVRQNKDKIAEDISKMITYGELIYEGLPRANYGKRKVKVYLRDSWVVIVDALTDNVVTLYNVDLRVEKEFTTNNPKTSKKALCGEIRAR